MLWKRSVAASIAVLTCSLLLPAVGWAQQASGISGLVQDTSGGVLPGVTVEAASPVLIEQVRTAVTDGQGRYSIIDLRRGTYVVTFSLPGFATVRREGVELTAGFTATVNADMPVGSIQETVTVTGASPLVDVQTVRQQQVISTTLLDALPTGSKTLSTLQNFVVGLDNSSSLSATNVGGSRGEFRLSSQTTNEFHGKLGGKTLFDGMRTQATHRGGTLGYLSNPFTVEEMVVETGAAPAESVTAGVVINMIPKEGSNSFIFGLNGLYTNSDLQNSNLTDALSARGLTTVNMIENLYDFSATAGGPIIRDRLRFYAAHRNSGSSSQQPGLFSNATQGTPFYTPDMSIPGVTDENLRSDAIRLTWQATLRNKVSFFADNQNVCVCKLFIGNRAVEALPGLQWSPQGLYLVSWTLPLTDRLLLEAGASAMIAHLGFNRQPGVSVDDISILDVSRGFRYNDLNHGGYGSVGASDRYVERFSVTYVTGSHSFKAGFQVEQGVFNGNLVIDNPIAYKFNGTVPSAVDLFATPFETKDRLRAELGIYVQDRWTVDRLTVNLGLRFDYFNAYVPAQSNPAGPFVPARDFGRVDDVPSWKDVNPRFAAAYDLFGDGQTALKVSMGRYLGFDGVVSVGITNANNPMVTSVNRTSRTWSDTNLNYFPDCDLANPASNGECGPNGNQNFGQLNVGATRWADEVLRGYSKRDYFWDFSTEVEQQLRPGISVKVGYYRNWYDNFRVTDNLAVTSADYDPYCITAPVDAQLPGGGGYEVCGLADVSPTKFGQVENLVTQASQFGPQTKSSDFIGFTFNTRFGSGIQFGGGVDTGRTVTDRCFVVDSPQELVNCRVETPFGAQTQVKLFGSYPLPWDFSVAATFVNTSGIPVEANQRISNAVIAPSLGRNLAACGTRPVETCTATASVPLISPQTMFESRRSQIDLRLSKLITAGPRVRVQVNFDVYNVLNADTILRVNNAYGPTWLRPNVILDSRLIEFGAQLTF